jgi:hypothetical protein
MATILCHDNTTLPLIGTKGKQKALTLEQMQKAVGGYIEHVYDREGKLLMVVNEEGQYIDAPINEPARIIIAKAFGVPVAGIVPIRGNVILCKDLGDEVA